MTVSTELSHEEYVGNGVTTDFDFRFRIFEGKHLIVVVADSDGNETTLKNGTDYTIVGAGSYHGGKVVLNKPLAQGWKILLERDLPVVQETDLRNQGKFFAEVHEDAFDYLTMLIQKALGTFSLSLRKPTYLSNYYDAKGNRIANLAPPKMGSDATNKDYVDNSIKDIDSKTLRVKDNPIPALPSAEQRRNKILAFDDNGQPITVLAESGSASDVLIELAKPTGIKAIGSNHRGNLSLDLTAIDRRPDGYNNDIQAVLDNGNDVEINKDQQIYSSITLNSKQYIQGVGGVVQEKTGKSAIIRIDAYNVDAKEAVSITNLDTIGSVDPNDETNESVESYAIYSYNTKYLFVNGIRASGLTGGVYLGNSKSAIVSGITAHDTVYHPKIVRGGYAVLTDNSKETIINNIAFDVSKGNDGRHLLYMSTGGHGNNDGNKNIIANNLISKYSDKNDRNFPTIVIRKSERFIINNLISDGANGGIAFNMGNGEVTDYIISNLVLDQVKYKNGIGVYGISQGDTPNIGNRWLISNTIIRIRPAIGLNSQDCVAVNITHGNGMLSNLVCSVPNGSSPILIGDTANNVIINGILDNILPYDDIPTAPLIAFTGHDVRNIKISSIKTHRPIFARLWVVTDLMVDFQRKARVSIGNGSVNKIDDNSLINTVNLTHDGIEIIFQKHVTQYAVENTIINCINEAQVFIKKYTNKTLTIKTYTIDGNALDPTRTEVTLNIILSS